MVALVLSSIRPGNVVQKKSALGIRKSIAGSRSARFIVARESFLNSLTIDNPPLDIPSLPWHTSTNFLI